MVDIQGPSDAQPGSQAGYTVAYGNVGALSAPGASLTVTLPTELTFASANVPPTTMAPLTWDLGVLDASQEGQLALTLNVSADAAAGTAVSWQAELTSAAVELRTTDNQDVNHLLVGYRVLLPVMRRH